MSKQSVPKNMAKGFRNKIFAELNLNLDQKFSELNGSLEKLSDENNKLHKELYEVRKNLAFGKLFYVDRNLVLVKTYNGLMIYVDPRDISVTPTLALEGIWEEAITKAWMKCVTTSDQVIFDIGANFGYYGALAAQKLQKTKSKVIFFEPNPNLIPYIDKTLAVNWLTHISKIEDLGAAESSGNATLSVFKDYIGSSSLHTPTFSSEHLNYKTKIDIAETIKIKKVALDDYCKENGIKNVDLIKMDIEGFEEKAYAGMAKTVKSSPKLTLFLEFTKDGYENPSKFYGQMLKDFGNLYTVSDDGDLILAKDTSFESVMANANIWVMLVFSKNKNLAK